MREPVFVVANDLVCTPRIQSGQFVDAPQNFIELGLYLAIPACVVRTAGRSDPVPLFGNDIRNQSFAFAKFDCLSGAKPGPQAARVAQLAQSD